MPVTGATDGKAVAATTLELIAATAIGYGLLLVYPPATWVWIGVAAFGAACALEASRSGPRPPGGEGVPIAAAQTVEGEGAG
jgi:hypothetical protein